MKGVYIRGKTYWLRYTVNGRRIFESAETTDKRTAEILLKKRVVEVHEGKFFGRVKDARTGIPDAINEYLTVYARERKATWEADEAMLRRFEEFVGPKAFLQDLVRLDIERFQGSLLRSGLSGARVNRYTACLKTFFNRHMDWGRIKANPVRGLKMFSETMQTRYLEVGQIQALIAECSDGLRPIILTALLTGLRQGDIFGLRWDQIDFESRTLLLNQKKTKKAIVIHLSDALIEVLKAQIVNPDCPLVFHHEGKRVSPHGWLKGDFKRAVKAAGLPAETVFHTLRHTFATQQRFLGRDITVVKELLGHRSINTTMRYAHFGPTELRDAVQELGEKIAGKIQIRDNPTAHEPEPAENGSESTSGMWRNGRRYGLKNPQPSDGDPATGEPSV
jgi:integrase